MATNYVDEVEVNGQTYEIRDKNLPSVEPLDEGKFLRVVNGAWTKAAKPSYSKSDVGLGNVDNVKQYSVSNPPPYPVTSVNGKTGKVTINVPTIPSTTSLLKGNGSGGLVAATRGSDYIASGNIVKQTLVASETTPTENYAINWVYG